MFADLIVLLGVLLCARAGYLRDRTPANDSRRSVVRGSGLLLCFVAGLLTPLLNLALTTGAPITDLAIQHGATTHDATNGVWGLAVSAGSLPSIIFCIVLLQKKPDLGWLQTANRDPKWRIVLPNGPIVHSVDHWLWSRCTKHGAVRARDRLARLRFVFTSWQQFLGMVHARMAWRSARRCSP